MTDTKWAESLADAQPGESLWLSNGQFGRYNHTEQVVVVRRGRSLVYIEQWGRERGFRMEDGNDSKHTSRTPGPPSFLFTEADRLHRERMADIRQRADALGIERAFRCVFDDLQWIALIEFAETL